MHSIEHILQEAIIAIKKDREASIKDGIRDVPPAMYAIFADLDGDLHNLDLAGFMYLCEIVGHNQRLGNYSWVIEHLMTNVYVQDEWIPVWPDNPCDVIHFISDGYIFQGNQEDMPIGRLVDDFEGNPETRVTEAMTLAIARRGDPEPEFGLLQLPYEVTAAGDKIIWGEPVIHESDVENSVVDGNVANAMRRWVTLQGDEWEIPEGDDFEVLDAVQSLDDLKAAIGTLLANMPKADGDE